MFCPECRSEYVDGIARCRSCDVELVDELATQSVEVDPVPEPRVVLSSTRAEAVAIAKSILIDAQIPFGVRGEGVQDLFGYGRFPAGSSVLMGPIQIVVAPSDEEAAHALLASLRDDAQEVPAADDGADLGSTRSVWALARPVSKIAVWLMLGAAVVQLTFMLLSELTNGDLGTPF